MTAKALAQPDAAGLSIPGLSGSAFGSGPNADPRSGRRQLDPPLAGGVDLHATGAGGFVQEMPRARAAILSCLTVQAVLLP